MWYYHICIEEQLNDDGLKCICQNFHYISKLKSLCLESIIF